ncbi:hypothetical protein [Clostridium tertium]|uniref:hypothetical protein n=1 Tax=Clostridium tertium TaxID=1559 RepID=UPI000DD08429|nr:hypothetical protein [Clostridium tertium]
MDKEMLLKIMKKDVNNKNRAKRLVELIKFNEKKLDLEEFVIFYEDLKEEYGDRIWEFAKVNAEFKELNDKYYYRAEVIVDIVNIMTDVATMCSKTILDMAKCLKKEGIK